MSETDAERARELAALMDRIQSDPDGKLDRILGELAAIRADLEPDEPEDEPEPAGCPHQREVLKAQDCTPWTPLGKAMPHTAVLTRCLECGQPESHLLIGAWTLEDLERKVPR